MKKRLVKLPIMLLFVLMLVLVSGCSQATDLMEEAEEQLEAAEEMLEEANEELEEMTEDLEEAVEELEEVEPEVEEVEEQIEEAETEEAETEEVKEYGDITNASFVVGDMLVTIEEAQTFVENESLGLPYVEGDGYLYLKGTIENNGLEAKTLGQVIHLSGYDESGDQLGNASSWIESDGIFELVEPTELIEFDDLYMYGADNSYITVEFTSNKPEVEEVYFKIDITEVSEESASEAEEDNEEMLEILSYMSYDIIAAIDQDKFEEVATYSEYSFIAPSLASNVYDGLFFEGYNWENCATDEVVYTWGIDSYDNIVEMTCSDFFDTHISDFNFLANEPEIKQARVDYFPELSDYQATHYVKYTSGNNVCYLIYEEIYFNEFILSGIAVGQE